MGWSINESARQLRIGRNTVMRYKVEGAPADIAVLAAKDFGLVQT